MRNVWQYQRLQLVLLGLLLAGCQAAPEAQRPRAPGPPEFVVVSNGTRGEWKGRMTSADRELLLQKHDQAEELFKDGLGFDVDKDELCTPFDSAKVMELTQLVMDKRATVTWRGSELLVETSLKTPERDSLIISMRSLLGNGVNVVILPLK